MPHFTNRGIVVLPSAATTWNPSDKSANAILSNGNLTLSLNTAANWLGARSIAPVASNQKVYYEIVRDAGANFIYAGFGTSTEIFTQNIGSSTGPTLSFGVFSGLDGFRDLDSADHGASVLTALIGIGDNLGIAFDSAASRAWFRRNGGNWNNNGSADPATNTGGVIVTVTGPYYAMGGVFDNGDQSTVKFSSASWTYTAPSGFSQLA